MRRACRKIWRSVPCTSRKSLRTESRKDMEEILRAKLSTIKEEPELCEESLTSPMHVRMAKKQKQGKKVQAKDKSVRCLAAHVKLKHSYVLFITGFASKGTFTVEELKAEVLDFEKLVEEKNKDEDREKGEESVGGSVGSRVFLSSHMKFGFNNMLVQAADINTDFEGDGGTYMDKAICTSA